MRFVVPVSLLLAVGAALAQEPAVQVAVYAEHHGGDVVYNYQVRNAGPSEVREFYLGCDCREPSPFNPRLSTPPVGISALVAPALGATIEVPETATDAPAGWRTYWVRAASGYHLYWRVPGRAGAGIGAGETLTGFRVLVPGNDPAYLSGYYTARVWRDGRLTDVTAPLALLDTTPPTLSIEAAAEAPAGAPAVYGRVRVTVRDDRDPAPTVVAESIVRDDTANQDATYRIRYSATDASGNRTSATAQVRLPAAAIAPGPAPVSPPRLKIRNNLIIQASLP